MQNLRRALKIHFSGQFLNIIKFWSFPIPYFFVVTSLTPNLVRKGLICTSRTNSDEKIKTNIHRNFEKNTLASTNRFHKFWNLNPGSDIVIAKIGSQICISCAKVDKRIKAIQEKTKLTYQFNYNWYFHLYIHFLLMPQLWPITANWVRAYIPRQENAILFGKYIL